MFSYHVCFPEVCADVLSFTANRAQHYPAFLIHQAVFTSGHLLFKGCPLKHFINLHTWLIKRGVKPQGV